MGAIVTTLAFPVPPRDISKDMLLGRGHDMVWLTTPKHKLRTPAVMIRRPGAKFTLLYSHGNAEDVGLSLSYLDHLAQFCQANVFAYEYPGYSISYGETSEGNCCDAIRAAYDHLLQEEGIHPFHIVLFGRSLGTGPTVDLASQMPNVGGVILQSPLESGIRCVMGTVAAYSLYPFDIFRNYEKVEKIKCPVFIIHGEADKVVPCHNGKALYNMLQKRNCHVEFPPLWIPWAGHNNMPDVECLQATRKYLYFLDRLIKENPKGCTTFALDECSQADASIVDRIIGCVKLPTDN